MEVDRRGELSMEVDDDEEIGENSNVVAALPWVEKHRPASFDEIISQRGVLSTLGNFLDGSRNSLPHLLFYGPPGTGKTTTALAIARALYGEDYGMHCLELNASDDRGIDVVRNNIKSFATTRQLFASKNQFKFIILDEADAMTAPAQAALRRVMEKYTQTTRFCMICNYSSKIIPALKSRCTRFRFSPLDRDDIARKLSSICEIEGIQSVSEGIQSVITLGEGDMRRCINILQSTYQSFGSIEDENIYRCCGVATPTENKIVIDSLLNDTFIQSHEKILKLKELMGYSLMDMVREVHKSILMVDLKENVLSRILDRLAEIEYAISPMRRIILEFLTLLRRHRLAGGSSEIIQIPALVAAFQIARANIE